MTPVEAGTAWSNERLASVSVVIGAEVDVADRHLRRIPRSTEDRNPSFCCALRRPEGCSTRRHPSRAPWLKVRPSRTGRSSPTSGAWPAHAAPGVEAPSSRRSRRLLAIGGERRSGRVGLGFVAVVASVIAEKQAQLCVQLVLVGPGRLCGSHEPFVFRPKLSKRTRRRSAWSQKMPLSAHPPIPPDRSSSQPRFVRARPDLLAACGHGTGPSRLVVGNT